MAKRVVLGVVALLVVGLIGVYVFAYMQTRAQAQRAIDDARATAKKHEAAFTADETALREHPVFAYVGNEKPATFKIPAVPDALSAKLKGGAWWTLSEDADVKAQDTTWIAALSAFDHWELHPVVEGERFDFLSAPLPDFNALLQWSKVHLIKTRAFADVRHVARLCHSTETLVGALFSATILDLTRLAGDTTLQPEDIARMRRVAQAYPAYGALFVDPPAGAFTEQLPFAMCAALNESGSMAQLLRPYLEDGEPELYKRQTQRIDAAKACRLGQLRKQWHGYPNAGGTLDGNMRTLCALSEGGDCPIEMPGTRALIGRILFNISGPAAFSGYR